MEYARVAGLDEEQRGDLLYYAREMDRAYLAHAAPKKAD